MTPLQHAVSMGQTEEAWHLLAAGADKKMKSSHGFLAEEMAKKDRQKAILAMFADEFWMEIERPVGEGLFQRELSGRELREVYQHGQQDAQLQREHGSNSWSYLGTDWLEYLGYSGDQSAWMFGH